MKHNHALPLKACIEFIQSYKKGYTMGDAPLLESPEHVSSKITEDRIFPIPTGGEPRTLGLVYLYGIIKKNSNQQLLLRKIPL